MAVYVGIDVHKRFCQAALMNEDGIILGETRFENTLDGATSLVNLARSIDSNVKAVVEPSANYWMKVYDKLEEEDEVKLSNPSRTKAIAEARVKMDKLDIKTLACLLRGNLVAESYVPTKKNFCYLVSGYGRSSHYDKFPLGSCSISTAGTESSIFPHFLSTIRTVYDIIPNVACNTTAKISYCLFYTIRVLETKS